MQTIGSVLLATALAVTGSWPNISTAVLTWATALALLGAASLFLLYRGLALGPIAVVSPLVASYSALTVLLVVVLLGERLSIEQVLAIAVVLAGVLLATTDIRQISNSLRRPLPGVPVALAATVGFACWGTLFAAAAREHDGLALVLMGRAISIPLLAAAVILTRSAPPAAIGAGTLALVAAVGTFDTLANVAFMLGLRGGSAAIVVTGSGLYPLLPALLGIARHGERLAANQYLGIAVVVGGLVALGPRG